MKYELPADARVKVAHLRVPVPPDDPGQWQVLPAGLLTKHELRERGYNPAAKGGMTLVQIEFADGNVSRGASICSPRDNFAKATGREIALGRALKLAALGLSVPYERPPVIEGERS